MYHHFWLEQLVLVRYVLDESLVTLWWLAVPVEDRQGFRLQLSLNLVQSKVRLSFVRNIVVLYALAQSVADVLQTLVLFLRRLHKGIIFLLVYID